MLQGKPLLRRRIPAYDRSQRLPGLKAIKRRALTRIRPKELRHETLPEREPF